MLRCYNVSLFSTKILFSHLLMEVNDLLQFVERNQKKAFSRENKLHMMQNIAEEYSIKWDSWAFQDKLSASPEAKYVSSS